MNEEFMQEKEGCFALHTCEGALTGLKSIKVEIIIPHIRIRHLDSQYNDAKAVIERDFPNHHKYVIEGSWSGKKAKATKFEFITRERKMPIINAMITEINAIMCPEVIYAVYSDITKLTNF